MQFLRLMPLILLLFVALPKVSQANSINFNSPTSLFDDDNDDKKTFEVDEVESRLRALPDTWAGVPYRYGGTTRRGIDCSAFVQAAYREVFGVNIPRTTQLQLSVGYSVSKHELMTGDIILFRSRSSGSGRHVGIYIGNDEFVHISSSRGGSVKIVNLTKYLKARSLSFLDARRVARVVDTREIESTDNIVQQGDLPARVQQASKVRTMLQASVFMN